MSESKSTILSKMKKIAKVGKSTRSLVQTKQIKIEKDFVRGGISARVEIPPPLELKNHRGAENPSGSGGSKGEGAYF